ncbi:MAG: hypothetical protein WKF61_01055 [Luteimonas sp.]
MDAELLRNTLTILQIIGGVLFFFLIRAWNANCVQLERAHIAAAVLTADLAAYKLHVAETYMTSKAMESMLAKLDRIEDKLDKKQDR